ncbi:hypothetical protein [Pseudoxanthomonas sp. JBR18]|uniref:hypothetical protein n=1 Tax=Pseudoxanthomonas sp. JBR18 TaxID=2969308 RepID=UPI002305963B|nr:hypothetical protein [Pseudoxanthomonas sp. JBR18]WCE06285.1 hypothetical protein PJ250_10210 [Pseudoxanthomonas sp. JBR18]
MDTSFPGSTAPATPVGVGPRMVQPVVLDPVSGEPLVRGRYRLVVKAQGEEQVDMRGVTDVQGHTVPVRLPQQAAADALQVRPTYGQGAYNAQFHLTLPSGKPNSGVVYQVRFSDGSVFVGRADAQGNTAELLKPTALDTRLRVLNVERMPDWQVEARLANASVTATTADARTKALLRLFEQASEAGTGAGRLFDGEQAMSLVRHAAMDASTRMRDSVGQRYVQWIAAQWRASARVDGADPDAYAEQGRFIASLHVIDDLVVGRAEQSLLDAWLGRLARSADAVAQADRQRAADDVLLTCARMVDQHQREPCQALVESAHLDRQALDIGARLELERMIGPVGMED